MPFGDNIFREQTIDIAIFDEEGKETIQSNVEIKA